MSRRDEIRRRALRAAAAVTGRGHHRLEPVMGAALALSLASCQTTPPKPAETAPEKTNPPAEAPEPVATKSATGETCLDDKGKLDTDCCLERDLEPKACQKLCESSPEGNDGTCFSCPGERDMAFFEGECCKKVQSLYSKLPQKLAGELMGHCTPWGPPAPPEHTGVTIAELLGDAPLTMFVEAAA